MTVSLIAVLIPLLFMGDVVGRLFREFAITLVGHDFAVGRGVADPRADDVRAHSEAHHPENESTFLRKTQKMFDDTIAAYGDALNWVLDHQTLTLLVAIGTLVLTAFLYIVIPKGFFPVQDTGLIQGISQAPQSISYAAMADKQQALAKVILQDPDVDSLSSFIGVDGTNLTLNSGRFLINLKPLTERSAECQQYHPPPQ